MRLVSRPETRSARIARRVACGERIVDSGHGRGEKLREAGQTHIAGIRRLFLEHFSEMEIDQLASLGIHVSPGFAALIFVLVALFVVGCALRASGALRSA